MVLHGRSHEVRQPVTFGGMQDRKLQKGESWSNEADVEGYVRSTHTTVGIGKTATSGLPSPPPSGVMPPNELPAGYL